MKHITRRRVGSMVAAIAVTAVLAACGGGKQPGGGDGASAWVLTGGSEPVFKAQFDSWNSENSEAKITTEWFANDAYKEKIRTAVGAGNAPTLIYSWSGGTLADYVANKNVVDISDVSAKMSDKLLPSVAANGVIDGKTYAVPNSQAAPVILYYNKQVLDSAGVSVPTTWDELLSAVATLKSKEIIPIALAGQSRWPELMYIQYLTDRLGGPEAFQAVLDGEKGAWSNPAFLEATTKIKELVDAGAFGNSFGSVVADQNADTALLHTGKAGFLLQGSWVYPTFMNDAPEFMKADGLGFTTFPTLDGGQGDPKNIVGNPSNFWSVSADATPEAQETAKNFLAAKVLDDASVTAMLAIGTVPPISGLESQIAQQENSDYLSFVYGMVRDAPHFQLSWDQALPPAQAQALLENLSQLFLGQITPEKFCSAMDATL